jgi:SnoaL-like protein
MVSHLDVIRASDEAFNAHDVDGTAHACIDNFTYTDNATGETFKGVDEFRAWLDSWFDVVHQSVERATNKGPLGPLPATGRSMSLPFCEVWRLDTEGRIVAGDLYYDQLSLMTQLGHIQSPSAE